MTLLNPGYWPETYWPSDYWDPAYWPKYGVPPATPSHRPIKAYRPRPKPKPPILAPDIMRLLKKYLELKVDAYAKAKTKN